MCGIVGAVSRATPVTAEQLHRMAAAVEHRGPDEGGHRIFANAGLGVRRLRIIDLVTGGQPIANEDESVWTVQNGEIYNFQELRIELEEKGHRFRTQTDTECIVHAYEEHGDGCVTKFRGMFALAIWDDRRKRLLLARDRLGKKPLVYAERPDGLTFGSEIQTLLAGGGVPRDLDVGALGDYLAYGYVPGPATIFRAIRKLPPAHTLTWDASRGVEIHRYWSLAYQPKLALSASDALEELERRLDQAVRLRLISDVPLGALLSGGVDSSAIVALMARHSTRVKTFSIGFDERPFNELAHARRVSERYGTEHHELLVRPDAAAVLPKLARHYGEPFADSSAIPTYYVCKLARQHVTVALNGDGGDETFAGYDRYRGMLLADRIVRLVPSASRTLPFAAVLARAAPLSAGGRSRLRRFLSAAASPPTERYGRWMSTITPDLLQELLVPNWATLMDSARSYKVERTLLGHRNSGLTDRLLATDVQTYLPDDLLVKMDIASMANSLETRSPLLDQEVVEFAARCPEDYKLTFRDQKVLLKRLARRLVPAENIDRPKQGFAVPISRWLRSDLRDLAGDLLLSPGALQRGYFKPFAVARLWNEHQQGHDRSFPLWTLLMLELWHREVADAR